MFDMTPLVPGLGEDGFDQSKMIPDLEYTVLKTSTFNLSVPPGADSYHWTIELSKDAQGMTQGSIPEDFDILQPSYGGATSNLVLYLPATGLGLGTYKLTAVVVYKEKTYTDSCLLVVRGGGNINE